MFPSSGSGPYRVLITLPKTPSAELQESLEDRDYGKKSKQKKEKKSKKKKSKAQTSTTTPPEELKQKKWLKSIQPALTLYQKALAGHDEALEEALELFQKIYEEDSDNGLAGAYYGDTLSRSGLKASGYITMFINAHKGMKILDQVVLDHPDNLEIRKLRAYHSFRLPEGFFRRTVTCIGDFEYFLQRYASDPALFSQEEYHQLLYDLGLSYKRIGMDEESAETWQKLSSLQITEELREKVEAQRIDRTEELRGQLAQLGTKEELMAQGIALHDQGLKGDVAAAKVAHEFLEKACEKDRDDALALAYYGCAFALQGKDATDPQEMFRPAAIGLKTVDQALEMDDNPKIRLLRARLAVALPEHFFRTGSKAARDYQQVLLAYEEDHSLLTPEEYEDILYATGAAYLRAGNKYEAKKWWSKLLEVSTDEELKKKVASSSLMSSSSPSPSPSPPSSSSPSSSSLASSSALPSPMRKKYRWEERS
ncbi:hypothetical protein F9B85_12230 [Heliorestis acidaminivorans]|uniref:Tetratricopeptide repeat protein n=1 Tax=Heliorestis acidaminivorans TaxID=553427 RepID=A0A6I0F355_9FIRM|nr:hypothetical protein [Heliorestis acidaminivorans]KAB2951564.1 hypothetical protein F9B85_12230 [Heliorestis acidaminivorans]